MFSTVTGYLGEAVTSVNCSAEVRAENQCNLAPFTGTWVCREYGSLLGNTYSQTICAQNILPGFTVALNGDTCGCCPDTGCPKTCGCPCEDDPERVMVKVKMLFGLVETERCVTNGWSQHIQAWTGESECIEATVDSCPYLAAEAAAEAAAQAAAAADGTAVIPEN